jgi:methylthioribose-1-phosphate isomerase
MAGFHTIEWINGAVRMLDQRKLPQETIYNDYTSVEGVAEAIQEMVIRGAPAIGAAAAYGMALAPCQASGSLVEARQNLEAAAITLQAARPTAANLSWAISRMMQRAADPTLESLPALRQALLAEAETIADEDIQTNHRMASNAQQLIPDSATILHHCNTGSLATVDYGTALGAIRMAHETGKKVFVLIDETRPRLQGARLTAWELMQYGIPFKVIVDGASGHYMRTRGVDLCLVGCDRVAANGDTANKIGTYNLAIVAHEHNVPFYVVGPTTTIDMQAPNGASIQIEERSPEELTHIGNYQITPDGAPIGNPAFDVTPARYISAIITERGIVYPPFQDNLRKISAA